MPKSKDPGVPQAVTIMYNKGEDHLQFESKPNADAAVKQLLEDVSTSVQSSIITVEDDVGKTINFKAGNFVRTIAKPTSEGWM